MRERESHRRRTSRRALPSPVRAQPVSFEQKHTKLLIVPLLQCYSKATLSQPHSQEQRKGPGRCVTTDTSTQKRAPNDSASINSTLGADLVVFGVF